MNCQKRGAFFKIKCVELLNGHRDTQRSTHGTRDKCTHIGTAPVTYHLTRSYMIFIVLNTEASADYAVQPTVQCEEVWVWCYLCVSVFVCMFVCTCVRWERKVYRPFQHKNTRRNDSEWRQSAHTKGKSKAEIAPALHITCDQAYPVNNTQQLVNIMAYMVYSTLLTSTVRS